MDEKRIARYIDGLSRLRERIEDVLSWIDEAEDDKKSKLAVYKAMQEAVETACDMISMSVRDSGIPPRDDYVNIERWGKMVNEDLSKCLKIANGLRNRLVHHYNGLDDRLAIESIRELLPCLKDFSRVMEKWLKEKLEKE